MGNTSLLAHLALRDCRPALGEALWEYPCGLQVADALVVPIPYPLGQAMRRAHQVHHDAAHDGKAGWQLQEHIHQELRGVRFTVRCDCPMVRNPTSWNNGASILNPTHSQLVL